MIEKVINGLKIAGILIMMMSCSPTQCYSQVEKDMETLLQKMIDLPELQPYFDRHRDKEYFLTILSTGAIPERVSLTYNDKKVNYMTREQLAETRIKHYLELYTLDINEAMPGSFVNGQ